MSGIKNFMDFISCVSLYFLYTMRQNNVICSSKWTYSRYKMSEDELCIWYLIINHLINFHLWMNDIFSRIFIWQTHFIIFIFLKAVLWIKLTVVLMISYYGTSLKKSNLYRLNISVWIFYFTLFADYRNYIWKTMI